MASGTQTPQAIRQGCVAGGGRGGVGLACSVPMLQPLMFISLAHGGLHGLLAGVTWGTPPPPP